MSDLKRLPLGEILVDKGYITLAQLFDALEYQMRLPPSHHKPLGEVLIDLDLVDKETLRKALSDQPGFQDDPIGRILVEEKVITDWQLAHALKEQFDRSPQHQKLGIILVQLGFATREAIEAGLKRHQQKQKSHSQKQTEMMKKTMIMSTSELKKTIRMSASELKQILLEELVVEAWQLEHIEHLMAEGSKDGLGTLLVKLGYATRNSITDAMAKYFDKNS